MTPADWVWCGALGLIALSAAYLLGIMIGFRAGLRQCERGHDDIRAAAFHAGRSGPWAVSAQRSADYLAGYAEGVASVPRPWQLVERDGKGRFVGRGGPPAA